MMRGSVSLVAAFLPVLLIADGGYAVPATQFDRVAVIVIDNFQPVPVTPPETPPSANCPYLPEDVNVVGDQGAGDDLPAGVSHGEAVYSRLSDELDGITGLAPLTTLKPPAEYGLDSTVINEVTGWTYRDREILLIGIDTNSITTGGIADRIRHVTTSMYNYGFKRFVLNMSFVIAPCNVASWLKAIGKLDVNQVIAYYQALINGNPDLQQFQAALDALVGNPATIEAKLLAADPGDGLAELRRHAAISQFYEVSLKQDGQVSERLGNDPIRAVLAELHSSSKRVVPVAAAGNGVLTVDPRTRKLRRVRFGFPFAPAIWNPVVSTSASGKDDAVRAAYSNSGEVILPGSTQVNHPNASGPVTVNGTSFAAPRLSALQAVYLLTGGLVSCGGSIPPLGYTNSDLSGQHWLNMTVAAAASAHCPSFTTPLAP